MATKVEHPVYGTIEVQSEGWPGAVPTEDLIPKIKVEQPDEIQLDVPDFPDPEFEMEMLAASLDGIEFEPDEEDREWDNAEPVKPMRKVSGTRIGSFSKGHRPKSIEIEPDEKPTARPANRLTILPQHVRELKEAAKRNERKYLAFLFTRAIPTMLAIEAGNVNAAIMLRDVLGSEDEPDPSKTEALADMAFGALKLEYLHSVLQDLDLPEEVKVHLLKLQGEALVKGTGGPRPTMRPVSTGSAVGTVAHWEDGPKKKRPESLTVDKSKRQRR